MGGVLETYDDVQILGTTRTVSKRPATLCGGAAKGDRSAQLSIHQAQVSRRRRRAARLLTEGAPVKAQNGHWASVSIRSPQVVLST